MELIQCVTCGANEFENNKCLYCGNEYKTTELTDKQKISLTSQINYAEQVKLPKLTEEKRKRNIKVNMFLIKTIFFMLLLAATTVLPPLFAITLLIYIVVGIKKIIEKIKSLSLTKEK